MDKRKNNGGNLGCGRKPKAKEIELIEQLSPHDELARTKLIEGVDAGSFHHLKLFYEYRYGKPKQQVDVTTNGDNINSFDLKSTVNKFFDDRDKEAKNSN